MKNFLRFAFLSCICICIASQSLYAQKSPQWTLQAVIPEDSLQYGHLFFSDSLHGYFLGQKFLNNDIFGRQTGNPSTYKEAPFYRTSDGGITWKKINYADVYGKDLPNFDTTLPPPYTGQSDGDTYIVNFAAIPHSNTCVISNMVGSDFARIPDTLTFYWSEDYGVTWSSRETTPVTSRAKFSWKAAPAAHEIIAMPIGNQDNDAGKFAVSPNDGIFFEDSRWDPTLLAYLKTNNALTNNLLGNQFDYFSGLTWIDVVRDTGITTDKTPYSLVTLLSTDADYSWQAYSNVIPHFPSGDSANNTYSIQCIRGTSYVYLFTFNNNGNLGSFPSYGVNYIYSSDYGKTWNIDTSFSKNRKAHYVSATSEIWCTATAHDSVSIAKPAHWITHTKDNGKNWEIDSVSLFNDGFYDGLDITFSDPRHGWVFAQTMDRHTSAIFKYTPPKNDSKVDIYIFKQYGGRDNNHIYYNVHPNPASTETTIQLTGGAQMTGIEFFDILGRRIPCSSKISENQTSAIVRTEGLTSGCFIAHISLIDGNYIVPFVVQH